MPTTASGETNGEGGLLDLRHGVVDQLADGRQLRVRLQIRPPRLGWHPEYVLGGVFVGVLGGVRVLGQQLGAPRLSFLKDELKDQRFDYILANPPEKARRNDRPTFFGLPPKRANF